MISPSLPPLDFFCFWGARSMGSIFYYCTTTVVACDIMSVTACFNYLIMFFMEHFYYIVE